MAGSVLSPFLEKGTDLSFCPICFEEDFSNNRQIKRAISSLISFKTFVLNESGPAALSGLRFAKSLITPDRSIQIYGMGRH